MRRLLIALVMTSFAIGSLAALAQDKKNPAKLTFTAKPGNVTFNHAEHTKRAGNDCNFCHDKLWPQSTTAPLNYKAAMHKTAEAGKTSCGTCHTPGGKAFATAGNCAKCHVKG